MNELIRETAREVRVITGYKGVCHSCNSPVEYEYEMSVIVVGKPDKDNAVRVVPVDIFFCPHCMQSIQVIKIYKSLDVGKELEHMKHETN